jgi:hypothetical protein
MTLFGWSDADSADSSKESVLSYSSARFGSGFTGSDLASKIVLMLWGISSSI